MAGTDGSSPVPRDSDGRLIDRRKSSGRWLTAQVQPSKVRSGTESEKSVI